MTNKLSTKTGINIKMSNVNGMAIGGKGGEGGKRRNSTVSYTFALPNKAAQVIQWQKCIV